MTGLAGEPSMRIPNSLRRLLEDLLPWYDRAEHARHDQRSEYIHQRSIDVRVANEKAIAVGKDRIRDAYRLADERLRR